MPEPIVNTEAEERADLERRSAEYKEKFFAHRKADGLTHQVTRAYGLLWHKAELELATLPDLDEEGYER